MFDKKDMNRKKANNPFKSLKSLLHIVATLFFVHLKDDIGTFSSLCNLSPGEGTWSLLVACFCSCRGLSPVALSYLKMDVCLSVFADFCIIAVTSFSSRPLYLSCFIGRAACLCAIVCIWECLLFIYHHFVTCNVHTQAFSCVRLFPRQVWYSIDSGTLNEGSECFKAKAWHVKEINALLLSPALIRALLSAENDRACTFHYVLLLVSVVPHPSLLLALSFFFYSWK